MTAEGVKWQVKMVIAGTCTQSILSRTEGEHISPGTCCEGQEGEVGGSEALHTHSFHMYFSTV